MWKEIEASKTVSDLRKVLKRRWKKYSDNLGVLYYDIWWNDEFLLALRTVQMTESEEATFLTSEQGFSLLHIMPRTWEEIQVME